MIVSLLDYFELLFKLKFSDPELLFQRGSVIILSSNKDDSA